MQNSRGAYTAMRTWQRREVVAWATHLARLEESAALLAEKCPDMAERCEPPKGVDAVEVSAHMHEFPGGFPKIWLVRAGGEFEERPMLNTGGELGCAHSGVGDAACAQGAAGRATQ